MLLIPHRIQHTPGEHSTDLTWTCHMAQHTIWTINPHAIISNIMMHHCIMLSLYHAAILV